MRTKETTYLGDGVYATFDEVGYDITLDLRGQDNTTKIVLEKSVYEKLVDFANKHFRKPST